MPRYLVTGGAGFIGSALVRHLTASGHEVAVLDDLSRGRLDRIPLGPEVFIVHGDVRDLSTVRRAAHGCDGIIHMAYLQGTQTFYAEPRQVLDVATRGILNVLEACEKDAVGELMLISSSEAYQVASVVPTPETIPLTVPDPLNPRYSYGGGKIHSELMALAWQRTGILDRLIIARPHNIYGPDMGREHVIPEFCIRMNQLTAAQPEGIIGFPIQGTGEETRSFCWIGDCVSQLSLLLGKAPPGASVFNVGTMDEWSIANIAQMVAACYGRQVKVMPGKLPKGSPPRRLPDMAKMHALGSRGHYPIEDGMEATAAWYMQHG
jgi:nucleoside-diphosphate-sugar epimerase